MSVVLSALQTNSLEIRTIYSTKKPIYRRLPYLSGSTTKYKHRYAKNRHFNLGLICSGKYRVYRTKDDLLTSGSCTTHQTKSNWSIQIEMQMCSSSSYRKTEFNFFCYNSLRVKVEPRSLLHRTYITFAIYRERSVNKLPSLYHSFLWAPVLNLPFGEVKLNVCLCMNERKTNETDFSCLSLDLYLAFPHSLINMAGRVFQTIISCFYVIFVFQICTNLLELKETNIKLPQNCCC